MKKQIRLGVFESNSSSTHTLTICSEKEYNAWKNGELLFNTWSYNGEKFVKPYTLSKNDKENARVNYMVRKEIFWKDWGSLSEEEKEKWYAKYALENDLKDEDHKTYDEYMEDCELYIFEEFYTTENGDRIVVFGKYGYDG
jgi:hypothetical protein